MKVTETRLKGVLVIEPDVFRDERGYFFESFSQKKYNDIGINYEFVQDNISKSTYGTLRGLHYQVGENAQGKLCQVIQGKVLDIAVDIRFNSPTFGQYVAVELSDENHRQLWIPPGFAHGFSVHSSEALFHYKCTAFYSKPDERSIIYCDGDLNIDWKIENPVVSEKDKKAIAFRDIEKDFLF
ncbi:MAG: dTDP-4-dehydrorhamnose 3,5-epimerase [Bacteroidota bacterium]|jgi:dTDP-4-dehydrorhamnose 3,5-epimerase|nr:dTDP-4-dehydrorhamnose 3,5-epimerase [Ignavibacteria bacterium]HEX2962888.1 dTDP-4-dehydrorhamnose 3,5-epimerase [Ignavibacteriales bacterium]MCU7498914.1 dTDP-4-dehydrorhamnose 3,5-epimerase [Ignavibacteria bacterium]MCU7513945.1 dTDP-4-dehydrorhamnose 3,5-epimerase [Ignavibacteria bacterium]MCU7521359.1 dTDP-4-dehydrorhamnose 3,5-epimerase [Ignavibacteria bacterium]